MSDRGGADASPFLEVYMAKIVIALGGNALGDTPAEQLKLVADAASLNS
jgi:hypothetical protein